MSAQKHPATFQCQLCSKRFTRAFALRAHLRNHTDERPYPCRVDPTCNGRFTRNHDRKAHEKTHARVSAELIACKCGSSFTRKSNWHRHLRTSKGNACAQSSRQEQGARSNRNGQPESSTTGHISAPLDLSLLDEASRQWDQGGFKNAMATIGNVNGSRSNSWASRALTNAPGSTDNISRTMSAFIDMANDQMSAAADMAEPAILSDVTFAIEDKVAHPDTFVESRAALLERILQEKGFNVQAEMEALANKDASDSSFWQAPSAPILSFFPDEFSSSTAPMIVVTPPSAPRGRFKGSTGHSFWQLPP